MQTDASCCELPAQQIPSRSRAESAPERSVAADKLHAGTAEYRRACLALFLGGFATFSLLYNLQPLMPLLAHGFGLSPALASGAVSAATIALAAALIPAAILADRVGRKPVMVGALSLSTVFTLVGAFAGDFHSLLVSRALLGLTLAGLPAVAMAYLSEEFAPTSLARAMGLYISGNALGGLCGRFLAALIAEHADWRVALVCLAASSLLTTLLFWRLLPPSRHFQPIRVAVADVLGNARKTFADGGLRLLFAMGFLLMGCFTSLYNYLGFRLVAPPFSLSPAQIGMVFLLYLVGIVASNLGARLVERFGRVVTLRAMVALMLAGLAMSVAPQLPVLVVGVGIFTFGFFAGHSVAASWVGRRPAPAWALAAAIYLCCYYLGASLIGTVSGLAWQFDGWIGVAGCLGGGLLVAALIGWRLGRVS